MKEVLWLSAADVAATGVCELINTTAIVTQTFQLFDRGDAFIVPESALRVDGSGLDQACYCLPAYVGGDCGVCGVKWSAHGHAVEPGQSRIHASVILTDPASGQPLAMLNGTQIGAARTGAVTAAALLRLAPEHTRKVALCGAGGQAEYQLKAVLHALPQVQEICIWSRGNARNRLLAERYAGSVAVKLRPVATVEEAVDGADVVIGATSAPEPYLNAEHLDSVSLYCHIGFNEISRPAVDRFAHVIVDTWEEAKDVSGQSLFRLYRQGQFDPSRIRATLGSLISGRKSVARGTPGEKVMFDAFGLPIFDLAVARAAYEIALKNHLGTPIPW